jgi:3-oxoacyl-[acyl-carrier protein] reductase
MLAGKTALIYGGSGAIGAAAARTFAREGAVVHLAARSADALEEVAADIRSKGGTAHVACVDVLDSLGLAEHARSVAELGAGLDIVLNAVSFMHDQGTLIDDLTLDEFMLPIDLFMKATFNTAKAVAPYLRRGAVVLTLSTPAAKMTVPGHLGYAVTCAGIEAFSRCLAQELGLRGIRVVCIRPHAIADAPAAGSYTGALFLSKAQGLGMTVDEWLEACAQGTMLERLPTLQDVAETAAFIASDGARAMTGTVANLTCGQLVY